MEASKKLELNEEFAMFLLTENRPNNLANSQALQKILHHLNPTYDLPNADVMKSIQLKKMTEADAVIKESIRRTSKTHCIGGKQFPFLSLVWDAWSKSKKGYFGVGGIWYDPKLRENIYAVLGVKFFQGSHKAVDCQSLLLQCFSKYAILNSYVHLSIADGAGNVQNVCYESGDPKKQQLFPIRYCI
jgi:hypothetical protein